jgi:hypothetical protein
MSDSDYPTKPELPSLPCPACRDDDGNPTGKVPMTVWSGATTYQGTKTVCTTCWGQLIIDKVSYDLWLARQP